MTDKPMTEDGNYIYIVHAENEGRFVQPYSSQGIAMKAAKRLQSLKPEWNILISKKVIDDYEFWEIGYSEPEYFLKNRIKRCFDKQFILLIYFSLLVFLWFKI